MGRHRKSTKLTAPELVRFLDAARELHNACCHPLLATSSDDYRALRDLNLTICDTIQKLGHPLPWVSGIAAMSGLRPKE